MSSIAGLLLGCMARLPRWLLQWLGQVAGLVNHWFGTRAALVTAANLEVCGQDSSLRRQSLIETGRTLFETPAVWLASTQKIDGWIGEVYGEEKLRSAIDSNRGLLVLLPHLGNWELFNVFFRRFGSMTALYQPPRAAFMRPVMAAVRNRHGNEIVPTTRKGLARLYHCLNEGGTVVVLPDQVPATGRYVPFFGARALTDELSVRLLRKTGAAALCASIIRRQDGRFDIRIMAPDPGIEDADMDLALSAINRTVEKAVRLEPAQYQWEYKRFRERPAGEDRIYRFGKPPSVHR